MTRSRPSAKDAVESVGATTIWPIALAAALAVFQATRGPEAIQHTSPLFRRALGDYAIGEVASVNSSISRSLLRRTTGTSAPYWRRSASMHGRRPALYA